VVVGAFVTVVVFVVVVVVVVVVVHTEGSKTASEKSSVTLGQKGSWGGGGPSTRKSPNWQSACGIRQAKKVKHQASLRLCQGIACPSMLCLPDP